MKRLLIALALVLPSLVPLFASKDAYITTVILVRHAEKRGDTTSKDPELSEAGQHRAKELERVLGTTPVDAIYVTPYHRTRQTAAPLAKVRGKTPIEFPAGPTYAKDLAAKIRKDHPGQTVLVVGHSNSTQELMGELGVAYPPYIPESTFDDFFIVMLTHDGRGPKLLALRYGAVAR